MQGREGEVPLYAILRGGGLNQYKKVVVFGEEYMPSGGALSNPDDQALVRSIEDAMIEAFGKAIVAPKCRAGAGGEVDLGNKMLRACHVDALVAAVEECKVAGLDLRMNQLGDEGAEKLAAALRTNTTLTGLECAPGRPPTHFRGPVGALVTTHPPRHPPSQRPDSITTRSARPGAPRSPRPSR